MNMHGERAPILLLSEIKIPVDVFSTCNLQISSVSVFLVLMALKFSNG